MNLLTQSQNFLGNLVPRYRNDQIVRLVIHQEFSPVHTAPWLSQINHLMLLLLLLCLGLYFFAEIFIFELVLENPLVQLLVLMGLVSKLFPQLDNFCARVWG